MPIIETAKPYPFSFELPKTALIIIDMQRDFLEPGGFGEALGNDVSVLQQSIKPCKDLLEACRQANMMIIHTKEAHKPDLSDCPLAKRNRGNSDLKIGDQGPMGRILISGESGNSIVDELKPIGAEVVLEKPGKSAFFDTNLSQILEGSKISHLIFAGVTTEVCVQSTMRDANDRGYECVLSEDATASYFPKFKDAVLEMITAQDGIIGWTSSTAEITQALQE